MTQNYTQFENRLSEPEPNWKEKACSISIIECVDQVTTASPNAETKLIGGCETKMWIVIIGISQLIACTTGLATVFLFGQDELNNLLMLYFDYEGDDKRDFFKWIVTFLIVLFSNGIFWGFLLYLGAEFKIVCLLDIWLIAEILALTVTGLASILAMHAYIWGWGIETRFFPPSTVFPITCTLVIGHLLGQGRLRLVLHFVEQCESQSQLSPEQDAESEL